MTEKNEALRLADMQSIDAYACRAATAAELRRLSAVEAQRDALLEALRLIEMDARVMRPYVGQVTKLGEIARAAIKSVEGENT